MATRLRHDVYKLAEWDPILEWYARAVREMRTRDMSDPASWRFQAAVHEFRLDGSNRFWDQCQHNSWFFLPWHRWYLLYFEEFVAKTVVDLGGPADWSLPYWNYSENLTVNLKARVLPPAFRDDKMPDGSDNPLRIDERSKAANDGNDVTDDDGISLACLKERQFESVGPDGFGSPRTGFHHAGGGTNLTALEAIPHASIHGAVGGVGFMSRFNTAPLDPIFWLHHCNIDRLWEVWIRRDSAHTNPPSKEWMDDVSFSFQTIGGTQTKTARGVVDTVALGYQYEDMSDPIAARGTVAAAATEISLMNREDEAHAELIGASDGPVSLRTTPSTAEVQVAQPSSPALAGRADIDRRVYISLENITGDGIAMNYRVYVNDQLIGLLPMFGVAEASQATEKHSGGGLDVRFDVTRLVRATVADLPNLRVTFEPQIAPEDIPHRVALASADERSEFRIGRVSVYVA
jgi:tyrosinase